MAPIVLGYWDLRGLGQPIRFLLEYSGLEWEDKLYKIGPPPTFEITGWSVDKESLGLDFPNLPYLLDGDVKLSQSLAILRYLARKVKLDGTTEEEKYRMDLIVEETMDLKRGFSALCYSPNFANLKEDYLKGLPVKLERFSKFLGSRPYFSGKNLTFAEFLVYEALDQHKVMEPGCLKNFKNLEDFLSRIERLDKIPGYMKSPRFIKYPLFGKSATFGG